MRVRWLPVEASDAIHLSRWRDMLDAEELTRADRYHFVSDRDTFTAAHALARAMLSVSVPLRVASWRYVTGLPCREPALADRGRGGTRFNISHTRGFVACAIARDEVGVDVEASDRPTDFDIADRFFAPEEARLVKSAPPEGRACVFFRFWTLKEAQGNRRGRGARGPQPTRGQSIRAEGTPRRTREATPSRQTPAGHRQGLARPANGEHTRTGRANNGRAPTSLWRRRKGLQNSTPIQSSLPSCAIPYTRLAVEADLSSWARTKCVFRNSRRVKD